MTNPIPTPIPNPQSPIPGPRTRANRANARHSTGPRTEPGKQRSSLNALRHGLPRPTDPDGTSRGTEIQERSKGVPATARTALLPTEDPEAYQRHIQQFLDEYAPANPTETQLVHEIANTAWRLNRIPFLEAELLSQDPDPQNVIPQLATLGLYGSRLARQFQKALESCAISKRNDVTSSADISTKLPTSSYAISAEDFPGIPRIFQANLASFFQNSKSSATHNTSSV